MLSTENIPINQWLKKLKEFPDRRTLGQHLHPAPLGHNLRIGVQPEHMINGGRKVRNGDRTFRWDGTMLVTGTNNPPGLYATPAHGQAETTGPMITPRTPFVLVERGGSPEFPCGDDKGGVEHAAVVQVIEQG